MIAKYKEDLYNMNKQFSKVKAHYNSLKEKYDAMLEVNHTNNLQSKQTTLVNKNDASLTQIDELQRDNNGLRVLNSELKDKNNILKELNMELKENNGLLKEKMLTQPQQVPDYAYVTTFGKTSLKKKYT
ncbi:unnamed protein product [Ceutorhynchus assimilis]|uniref:Uncharacterized protein n=1 Tax=Ceutorhynchus assimilis TaxID=467358 RepID=A0A9P0DKT8_9CUCU|nr:unnamed protein product [Ceutorhynchus assimilis]